MGRSWWFAATRFKRLVTASHSLPGGPRQDLPRADERYRHASTGPVDQRARQPLPELPFVR